MTKIFSHQNDGDRRDEGDRLPVEFRRGEMRQAEPCGIADGGEIDAGHDAEAVAEDQDQKIAEQQCEEHRQALGSTRSIGCDHRHAENSE